MQRNTWLCSEIAATKEEHAAELESMYAGANSRSSLRLSDSEPQVNVLKSRVRTLQDKIHQQSGVIVELMEEVERLAEVEHAMGVRCLCYPIPRDHCCTDIAPRLTCLIWVCNLHLLGTSCRRFIDPSERYFL